MKSSALAKNLTFKFHHTMLPVANLDRAVDFYTHLLGMKLHSRHANPARKTDVALLGYGASAGAPFLELTQDLGEGAPATVTPLNTHIAIDVSDLKAFCGILEREGVQFIRPFKQRSDGKGFSAWIADPDGNALELAERY